MKKLLIVWFILFGLNGFAQMHPAWERPLKMAWSADGITFSNQSIFQDSSGVPSVVQWKGDTLVCVFQWFRQPINSPSWDRVAVKFSYDLGLTWTQPLPINVFGFPINYQRPFDPTLAVINNDSIRIYFSSSNGMPVGNDSIIDTHSAISTNGIDFNYEPNPRFNHPSNKVIDPAVIYFNGNWQYLAPIGAPQDGAFHCISTDGINFVQQANYISDFQHNWTGNFMINNPGELRFYGSGSQIWYNTSADGFNWAGYVNTNLNGGDPSIIRTGISSYLAVFVGQPYATGVTEHENSGIEFSIYPNPAEKFITINNDEFNTASYRIYSTSGKLELSGIVSMDGLISIDELCQGIYFITLENEERIITSKFVKAIKWY